MSKEMKERIAEVIGGIIVGAWGWVIFYQYFFIGG